MAFSYTLFFALVLLFPGLCAWAALRLSIRTDLVAPRPDEPNSTATLFIVVLGTLVGHLAGAGAFVIQAAVCQAVGTCFATAFDPNVYRVIFTGSRGAGPATDMAVFAWLFELAFGGVGAGALIAWAARRPWVRERWDAVEFGWLNPAVQAVKRGDAFIIAFVVTKTQHDGAVVGYQGIVQQLALGEHQTISMLVLRRVDRFLLKVTARSVTRIDQPPELIAQMQFHLDDIANVALEVIERPATSDRATP